MDVDDHVLEVFNPCTGSVAMFTYHHDLVVIRIGEDANGGFHTTITELGSVTTTDGFTGRFTLGVSGENASADRFEASFVSTDVLSNVSGARLVLHFIGHLTFANGELRSEVLHPVVTCAD